MLRIASISAVGWIVALAASEALLRGFGQESMGEDWLAVAYWSGLALVILVPLVYLPAMLLVRWRLRGYRPISWFPAVAAVLGIAPTALISFAWGGGLRGIVSSEGVLFLTVFAVFGVTFGFGYAVRRPPYGTHV